MTVEKTFEPDEFSIPSITFSIRSERSEAISLRLVDTIPENVPPDDIGFHSQHGAEFWNVEGNTIEFTRYFEPNEEYLTLYGLRSDDAADVDRFMTDPEIEAVDPVDGDPVDIIGDSAGAETDEEILDDDFESTATETDSTEREGLLDEETELDLPDIDEPPEDEADDGLDTGSSEHEEGADSEGETDDEPDTGSSEQGEGTDSEGETDVDTATDESVVEALAAELDSGEVDDDTVAELRNALGVTTSGSADARIEHLQSQVADLEAYVDALEEFLDEEGDAQTLIDDVRGDYAEVTGRVDDLEADVTELSSTVDERIDAELAGVEDDVESLEADVAELSSTVDERIDAELAGVEDDVESLEAKLERMEDDLADVKELRDRLTTALSGLGGTEDAGGGSEPGRED
jgi:uncharacterized coiled-coil protein SlyX